MGRSKIVGRNSKSGHAGSSAVASSEGATTKSDVSTMTGEQLRSHLLGEFEGLLPQLKSTVRGGISLTRMPKKFQSFLLDLLGEDEHYEPKGLVGFVSLDDVNILEQPRKTFDGIAGLAENYIFLGQIHFPLIAVLDREACARYLIVIEIIWNVRQTVDDLRPIILKNGELRYQILLSGERRMKGWKYLRELGCSKCRKKYGQESPGTCLRRHRALTKDGRIRVQFRKSIPLRRAFNIQIAENGYVNMPQEQEAWSLYLRYTLDKAANPHLTLKKFADDVNRSLYAVGRAIRYCEQVPDFIQEMVKANELEYGHAVEFGRFLQTVQQNGEDLEPEELQRWANEVSQNRVSVPALRREVSKILKERSSQPSLMDMFGSGVRERLLSGQAPKLTLASQHVRIFYSDRGYVRAIRRAFEEKKISLRDSPYSVRSPLRAYRALIAEMELTLPHLRELLAALEEERAAEVLEETGVLTDKLLVVASDEPVQGDMFGG